jgi:hypothetical protein
VTCTHAGNCHGMKILILGLLSSRP